MFGGCCALCVPHAVRVANDYVERFYNPKRLQSALDFVSPTEFVQRLVLK
jgi:transposase InsO family protein